MKKMSELDKFTVVTENGEKKEYEIVLTFDDAETNKSYVVYTDNSLDEAGNAKVYAAIDNSKEAGKTSLLPIESDSEWKLIEYIIESLQK